MLRQKGTLTFILPSSLASLHGTHAAHTVFLYKVKGSSLNGLKRIWLLMATAHKGYVFYLHSYQLLGNVSEDFPQASNWPP